MKRRRLWPETKFAACNSVGEQLAHIIGEIDEAAAAGDLVVVDDGLAANPAAVLALLPMLRELADVQASTETLWNILDRELGAGFSEALILSWTEEKNRGRGYYLPVPPLSFERLAMEYAGVSYRAVLPGGPRGGEEEHF